MNLIDNVDQSSSSRVASIITSTDIAGNERVLCIHCERTSLNGKKCIGRCVADNEY